MQHNSTIFTLLLADDTTIMVSKWNYLDIDFKSKAEPEEFQLLLTQECYLLIILNLAQIFFFF